MSQSENIAELAKAMAKVQSEIKGAVKDSENPFFKSSYADLESVWDACRESLTKNGVCVIQTTDHADGADFIVTTLAHSSGQWINGRLRLTPVKSDPQAMGSAVTYARRYALAAIVGVVQTDDDAESAMGRPTQPPAAPKVNNVTNMAKPVAQVKPPVQAAKPATAPRMATPAQAKMVWARLKNDLFYEDDVARDFIFQHTGKESSADLLADDIKLLVEAINVEMQDKAQ